MSALQWQVAGEVVMLLPQKAIYWPTTSTLIIADIHFGKAGTFRRLGVPVPHGTTAQNLQLIDELIARYPSKHLIFLGDFLHAAGTSASTLQNLLIWRQSHHQIAMTLVRGNHDLRAGDPPAILNIQVVDEPYLVKPFAFCHYPDINSDHYVIAGHVHPAFRLSSGHEKLRLPCFLFGASRAILPSFGAFTGSYNITPATGEHVFVVADDSVIKIAV